MATKCDPSASTTDTSSEQQADPPNPLTTVAFATGEELSILKCVNAVEAIIHEKCLKKLMEAAIRQFQQGSDVDPSDVPLDNVMPQLIHDFKTWGCMNIQSGQITKKYGSA